ncbi:hypothetical protein [Polyangium fumosum]|uniref:Uncharacterized protein n=1 Tax=Polyangium fumosum TaxID=889272 RepID=A0A4U1J018_9BACT|nr:hypothetical protein [Polyangium fumosum]TKD00333.1 hypothetical protein E8A74_35110 [Polyangium fumosum]
MNTKTLLLACAAIAAGCTTTEAPPPAGNAFSIRAGGSSCDRGFEVATSEGGDIALVGTFEGTIDFGGGPLVSAGGTDIAFATWDAEGKPGKSVRFGSASQEGAPRIVAAGGGAWVIAVNTQSELDFGGGPLTPPGAAGAAIGKLDADGKPIFSTMLGATVSGMAAGGDDTLVVTGSYNGTLVLGGATLTSAGATDVFVAKLDGSGAPLWARSFGSAGLESGMDIAVDGSGNVLLGGGMLAPVDFGGGPTTITGGVDAVLVKLDPDGNHVFTKTFGDVSDQVIQAVAADADGSILFGGLFEGRLDFGSGELASQGRDLFLGKLDSKGTELWTRTLRLTPAEWDDAAPRITVDPKGGLVVTGTFTEAVNLGGAALEAAGQTDVYFARYDATGKHVQSRAIGSSGYELAGGVAVDRVGAAAVTGSFYGTIDVGQGPLESAGECDIFLARFAAP